MSKEQGPSLNVLPETREQALKLVNDGKIMKAAGLVRMATGADRPTARRYVEGLKIEVLASRVPAEPAARARALTADGKPIAAAKYLVQATNLGLKDAKLYVDALRAGSLPMRDTADDRPLSERVKAYTASGDRPSAIALVRAETGMSPDEAERFVAALE